MIALTHGQWTASLTVREAELRLGCVCQVFTLLVLRILADRRFESTSEYSESLPRTAKILAARAPRAFLVRNRSQMQQELAILLGRSNE